MLTVRFAQSATLYQRTYTTLGSNNAAFHDAQSSAWIQGWRQENKGKMSFANIVRLGTSSST